MPPDSEVLNNDAYLLRLCQSLRSGYFSTIHGATYQPMTPLTPVDPASTATFWSVMYFFFRSGWPQFSRLTSTSPVLNPCQAISSLRFFFTTLQPSSLVAT